MLLFTVSSCRKPSRQLHIFGRKFGKILFILLLFTILFYAFSRQHVVLTNSLTRRSRNIYNFYNSNCCVDIMQEMRSGKWKPRRDIQSEDKIHRTEQDIRIRKLRGLPVKLHREDGRCGNMFVIGAPDFGPSVPSLCDRYSTTPCCNHELGRCGSGDENCLCDRCTDFRKTVDAEMSEFVASSGCEFQNFTSKQACQLLSERVSSLSLIGDSLVRHFHNALMITFTDDRETGCLVKDIDDNDRRLCSSDMQFVDGGKAICHGKTARKISQLPKGKFCRGEHSFLYSFHEFYSVAHINLVLHEVRKNLHKKNSVMAIGVGLHMGLDPHKVLNEYLKPILQLKQQAQSYWPVIVWLTTHAHGSLKPVVYQESQGNERIWRFNRNMRAFLEPVGVPVFDTFNLTLGVHSYDGTHYGFGVNMLKAQLFINFLDKTLLL